MKAFVLAAGMGERMRPLTDTRPKPLLEVGGRTMLDRTLDALMAAGVTEVVVNAHYLGAMIETHLKGRTAPRITISHEEKILNTGGGVKRMLGFFEGKPFFVLNADNVWTDGPVPALTRLARAWDDATTDVLLLLKEKTPDLAAERGDYYLPPGSDRPVFFKNASLPPNTVFIGPRIVHPRVFDGEAREDFGFLDLFLKAEAAGRLRAVCHDAEWYHVGNPEALAETNRILAFTGKGKKAAP